MKVQYLCKYEYIEWCCVSFAYIQSLKHFLLHLCYKFCTPLNTVDTVICLICDANNNSVICFILVLQNDLISSRFGVGDQQRQLQFLHCTQAWPQERRRGRRRGAEESLHGAGLLGDGAERPHCSGNATHSPTHTISAAWSKQMEKPEKSISRAYLPLWVIIQGIKMCVENFSRRPEHQTVDSCVVCLLSHGVEGAIYGIDGQLLQVVTLVSRFVVLPLTWHSKQERVLNQRYFPLSVGLGFQSLWQCTLSAAAEQAKDVFHPGLQRRWVESACSARTQRT